MLRSLTALLAVLLLIAGTARTAQAKRVAIVVGNDDYEQVTNLKKAVNDARAIGDALEGIGFEVIRAANVTRREMNRHIQRFTSRLQPGDEAFFFFAGHGVEIAGRNYLLPVDIPQADPSQEEFVKTESIAADRILERIQERGARVSILVLDACRDNPFPRQGTRSLGGSRGLARMAAPEGTFIIYSAGIGQTALDALSAADRDPNSVFTRSFIPLLRQPNLSLPQIARQVRRDVQKLAARVSHDQRPAYYDELTGDFYFAGRSADSSASVAAVPTDVHGVATARKEMPRPTAPGEECALHGSTRYCVSSILATSGANSYHAGNLLDGRPETAWVEGKSGDGIGEWIVVDFTQERIPRRLELRNGYTKNDDIFTKNSRVKEIEIRLSNGRTLRHVLKDSFFPQSLALTDAGKATWLQITILSVYPGSKYTDTAISELQVHAE